MSNKLLEIENLHIDFETYAGTVHAVRGVNFEVDYGETIAVVGESGCGKSVTAQSIVGLIPNPPGKVTQGKILLEGEDLVGMKKEQLLEIRGSKIGMIFQDPMTSLNPTLTIGYQIKEVLKVHKKLSKEELNHECIDILNKVGIPDPQSRLNQYPHEFSGGMRQRAMIAMGLVCHPKLLIADEPTTALDVTIQAQILDLMKDIQKQTQTSIILITHDLGVVAGMADRVIVMYAGQVVESGRVDDIFYNPSHPYTKALLEALPRTDFGKEHKLATIEGTPPDLIRPPRGCSFCNRCSYAMNACESQAPDSYSLSPSHTSRCFIHHEKAAKQKEKYTEDLKRELRYVSPN